MILVGEAEQEMYPSLTEQNIKLLLNIEGNKDLSIQTSSRLLYLMGPWHFMITV